MTLLIGLGLGLVVALAAVLVQRRRIEMQLEQVVNASPEPPSLAGSGLDLRVRQVQRIVERSETETHAADAERSRMTLALDALPRGIIMCDATGQIIYSNPIGSRFLNARHGDALVGDVALRLLSESRAGRSVSEEVGLSDPGRPTYEVVALPLGDQVPAAGALATIFDVTEQRRLEAIRSDFVANISHELKTPVGGLTVLAEAIADSLDRPEVLARLVPRLSPEAHRLGRLIDDLLELSQIEGHSDMVPVRVPVIGVFVDVVDRLGTSADNKRIEIVSEIPDSKLSVRGDALQLGSALTNLVDNAIKYSEPDSTITLAAVRRDSWVEISVEDEGTGIPRSDHERVFERFYRVDKARSRERGGTGLGLAIVRHVVSNHGGEIRLDSREGVGSKFTLVLPAVPELAPRPVDRAAPVATHEVLS